MSLNMKFDGTRPDLSQNTLRLVFDIGVTVLSVLFSYSFVYFFMGESQIWPLLVSPALVVGLNLAFGIFGRNRVASGKKKAAILLGSTSLATGTILFLGQNVASVILFFVLSFPVLVLPRYFLNLNRNSKFGLGRRVLQGKGHVLVVGGAGYIGTHVIDVLLSANYKVRVLDRLMYDRRTLNDFLKNPNFELIEGDATDISKLVLAMEGASAVVHLAGLVGDPACSVDPDYTRHTNVITTRMVKEVAISAGVERFIFASSCSVYGASDEVVNEASNLNPVSLYALTKIDSEKELLRAGTDDFCVTILRFATVFGDSRRPRFDLVVNLFAAQGFNHRVLKVIGPNQWRPFIHCRDLALAILSTLKAPTGKVQGEIFNVGDNSLNMTIGDLAQKVSKVGEQNGLQIELNISENVTDRRNYRVAFDKIQSVLGFKATYTIESGVQEIYTKFKEKKYGDYMDQSYSNLETTKQQVNLFYDPAHTLNLYRPIADQKAPTV